MTPEAQQMMAIRRDAYDAANIEARQLADEELRDILPGLDLVSAGLPHDPEAYQRAAGRWEAHSDEYRRRLTAEWNSQ